jgi:hypothetical protein
MYTGPHLIKDNLVFGYDTGYGVADNNTSTRYYPGGPTVNYVTDSSILTSGFGGSSTILDSSTKSFQLNINSFNASGQTWRSFMWDMRSHAGSAVTISATVEVPVASPGDFAWVMVGQAMSGTNGTQTANYLPYSTSSERYQKTTINTERITWSGTVGNTGTANQPNGIIGFTVWYNGGTAGVNSFIKVSNVQIELKSQATPFVAGTRSSTQSLIDIKKTTDINVSNISFDSTGQPTFDGTDDILNTGLFSGRNPATDPFTIEAIVKSDTTSGSKMWLDATSNGTNQRLYCAHASAGSSTPLGIQNSGWSHSIPQDTNYHHYVIVMDGSVARLYNNGEAHSTKNYTSYQIQALNVGGRSGYRWVGTIPVFKIHNGVLTADQVKQNYNAYKNRFDI